MGPHNTSAAKGRNGQDRCTARWVNNMVDHQPQSMAATALMTAGRPLMAVLLQLLAPSAWLELQKAASNSSERCIVGEKVQQLGTAASATPVQHKENVLHSRVVKHQTWKAAYKHHTVKLGYLVTFTS